MGQAGQVAPERGAGGVRRDHLVDAEHPGGLVRAARSPPAAARRSAIVAAPDVADGQAYAPSVAQPLWASEANAKPSACPTSTNRRGTGRQRERLTQAHEPREQALLVDLVVVDQPGRVDERHHRDVERVAQHQQPRRLLAPGGVDPTTVDVWLADDQPHAPAVDPGEPGAQ